MRFDINKLQLAIDKWSMSIPTEDTHIHIPDNSSKKREHLGLSMLAADCQRQVFYQYRKITKAEFPPRMLRLFQRGHREEFFFMWMLSQVGLKIYDVDPKTGKQFHVEDFDGHLQGSMDGVARDRKMIYVDQDKPFKLEFKTYNDKRFAKLVKEGVRSADPKYYGQMQGYLGYEDRLVGALFCAVNKNDDDLHFQWVPRDPTTFDMIRERAELILNSNTPPPGISKRKSFWKCKFCDFKDHCFSNDPNRKPSLQHCRSCIHASPAEKGKWSCGKGRKFGKLCDYWEDCNV